MVKPFEGEPASFERVALRMSRSSRATRLSLSANTEPRLAAMNVLPEPGLAEVSMMTRALPLPLSGLRNSRLVRATRKASLRMLRLPRRTIMPVSFCALGRMPKNFWKRVRFCVAEGISPTNGRVSDSMSRRPRTFVLRISTRKRIPPGITRPITMAIASIFRGCGLTGADTDGGTTNLVL